MTNNNLQCCYPQVYALFRTLEQHFSDQHESYHRVTIAGTFALRYFIETRLERIPNFDCHNVVFFLPSRISDETLAYIIQDFETRGGEIIPPVLHFPNDGHEILSGHRINDEAYRAPQILATRVIWIKDNSEDNSVRIQFNSVATDSSLHNATTPFWKMALDTFDVSVQQVAIHRSNGSVATLNDDVTTDIRNGEFALRLRAQTCPEKSFYQIMEHTRNGFNLRAIIFQGLHETNVLTIQDSFPFDY